VTPAENMTTLLSVTTGVNMKYQKYFVITTKGNVMYLSVCSKRIGRKLHNEEFHN
jgi:hypothetical protein